MKVFQIWSHDYMDPQPSDELRTFASQDVQEHMEEEELEEITLPRKLNKINIMKKPILLCFVAIMIAAIAGCGCTKTTSETRNLEYESYCDSIWNADPDYYMDVLVEGDEYQEYVELNGQWWK